MIEKILINNTHNSDGKDSKRELLNIRNPEKERIDI